MTLKLIQSEARELRAKTRRKLLGTWPDRSRRPFLRLRDKGFAPLGNVLHPLFAFALAWSLGRTVFPESGNVVRGDAGRCRTQHRSGVLPGRNRAPAKSATPSFFSGRSAPTNDGDRNIILALAMVGAKDRGLIPNGLPFLALRGCLDNRLFRHERLRELQELKREIDEWNGLERDNHAG